MKIVNKQNLVFLSILSGLLLSAAWPLRGCSILMLLALVPFIHVVEEIKNKKDVFRNLATFRYSYLTFFTWNVLTTFWVWNSTEIGSVLAFALNSFFMATTVQLAVFTSDKLKINKSEYILIPVFWLAFEYLHQHWDLSWSWLNMGNAFSTRIELIQWYEYTGVQGGTLWIWIVNILLYEIISETFRKVYSKRFRAVLKIFFIIIVVIPAAFSLFRFYSYEEKSNSVDVVAIQPNIDPYNEEYLLSIDQILDRLLLKTAVLADTNVDFYVFPESMIQEGMYEDEFHEARSIVGLCDFLKRYSPSAYFVGGAGTFKMFKKGETLTPAARRYNSELFYEAYNTALFFDSSGNVQTYHKSMLVPGVEQMPFHRVMKYVEKFAIDLGGTTGTLGKSKKRIVFEGGKNPVCAAICYESIYGEFVSEFVANGAELIFIITNDGWWKNTGGHRQHSSYASLRAIETRRSIARSANTGISCFINQKGEQFQNTEYWKSDVIRQKLNANDEITFYVRHGDFIGRGCSVASALLLLIAFLQLFLQKLNRNRL